MSYHRMEKRNEKCAVIALGKKIRRKKGVICCIKKKRKKPKSFMGWTSKDPSFLLVDDPPCGCWKLNSRIGFDKSSISL